MIKDLLNPSSNSSDTQNCKSNSKSDSDSDVYNPNHPDADWSGFVAKRSCRKHIETKPDQLIPAKNGSSFGPRDHVPTADWSKPARRIIVHKESGADGTSGSCVDIGNGSTSANANTQRSSTFSLIGGPIPVNSPSNFSPQCWETEAQAAARKRKTDLEQLTNNGRSMHVRGRQPRTEKQHEREKDDPKGKTSNVNHNHNNNSNDNNNTDSSTRTNGNIDDPSDLIGFRANFTSCTKDRNFLKEIGEAVTANLTNIHGHGHGHVSSSVCSVVSTAPYATETNLPTDPYIGANGERRKDLLLENFSSVVPGYTGRKTFIS
jgi:hypothetical protein